MSQPRIYGIDLGTTYSCIAYVDEHGRPAVVPNKEGQQTTPSVVFFEDAQSIAVGQAAKDVAELFPERVVSTVKRSMGDETWEFDVFDHAYRAEDVSAYILRKLVEDAEIVTGEPVTDVVITCPAYFGTNQREATKRAGELAGLNVHYVIPEPTAAAVAYGMDQEEDQVVMVFDLGGGTFDVTLMEITQNRVRAISTGGDHQLGGKDWDEAIVSYFAQRFSDDTGVPAERLLDDLETFQELLGTAEKVKIGLSTRASVKERVRYEGDRVRVELSREKFDELTEPLIDRCMSLTEEMLSRAAEKGFDKIDTVLLVGGSTFMPQVRQRVDTRFTCEVRQLDPNQIVAKGAALFGYQLRLSTDTDEVLRRLLEERGIKVDQPADQPLDVEALPAELVDKAQAEVAQVHGITPMAIKGATQRRIQNITSKSFGVVVAIDAQGTEAINNLVVVDDPVPATLSKPFTTFAEGQVQVNIQVMENTHRTGPEGTAPLEDGTLLGEAVLLFERALPKGSPVQIDFNLTPDGLLYVTGKDLSTGREIQAEFRTEAVRSQEELAEMKSTVLAMKRTD